MFLIDVLSETNDKFFLRLKTWQTNFTIVNVINPTIKTCLVYTLVKNYFEPSLIFPNKFLFFSYTFIMLIKSIIVDKCI